MKNNKIKRTDNIVGWSFVSPAVLIFIIFMMIPIFMTVSLSFTNYNGHSFEGLKFVGLKNYNYVVAHDEFFKSSLSNMLSYLIIVPLNIAISLGIALLIKKPTKTNSFFRVLYYIPVLTSAIATATVWKYLLDPNYGFINNMLSALKLPAITLMNRSTAKIAVIMVTIWMSIGSNMVLYIAGLKGLPDSLYEAANIEGANKLQSFRYITWPLLKPVTIFILTMQLISVPQMFDQVLVLTGINSISLDTHTPVFMIYNNITETGGSAALAVTQSTILFFIILIIKSIMDAISRKGEEI